MLLILNNTHYQEDMFKIKRRQLEDIREDAQSKLGLKSPAQQQQFSAAEKTFGRMTPRKRACPAGKQLEKFDQAKGFEADLLTKIPTNIAKEQKSKSIQQANNDRMTRIKTKTSTSEDDRIFTIATTVSICVALVTLLNLVCLFDGSRALLVSAQYSNPLPPSSSVQQTAARSQVVPIGRQQQQESAHQQQTIKVSESSPMMNVAKERHERSQKSSGSIDRFDSGEQIRPPLLRQPTTLAPLTSGGAHNDKQQVSRFNMQQAASSQESFMSPEERDQLLKQQESHYEGKSSGQDSGPEPGEGQQQQQWRPHQQAAEGKQGGGSQLQPEASNTAGSSDADDGDYEDDGSEPAHNNNNKSAKANLVPDNRRQSSSSPSTGGTVDGGFRRFSRPASRPIAAAAANNVDSNEESGDPSGDYDGANDDAYFSRKANGRGDSNGVDGGSGPVRLNKAASHHNQNSNHHQHQHHQRNNLRSSSGYGAQGNNRRSGPRGSAYGGSEGEFRGNRGNQETLARGDSSSASNEPEGFGPGPNEAYMADKAESGGKDPDDDSAYGGPGSEGEPGAGPQVDDDVKFDRRSMDEHTGNPSSKPMKSNSNNNVKVSGVSSAGYVRPINYDHQSESSPFGDQNNGGGGGAGPSEESEVDEGPDSSSDESGPSFAPSSQADQLMSRPSSNVVARKPNELQQANLVPVTADSRPVAAATGSQAQQPISDSGLGLGLGNQQYQQQQLVFNRQQTSQPFGPSASNQLPQPPALRNHPAPAMQSITSTDSNPINSLMNHQQQLKPSSQAPYNPQNNPSHVGKYFIN